MPPSVLLDQRSTSVYDEHFERERNRVAQKAKQKRDGKKPQKEVFVGVVKKSPGRQQTSPPPVAAALVGTQTQKSPATSTELKELSQQLDANRRLSVTLKRSLVQQAVVNAASKRLVDDDEETTSLDSMDTEEKNTSLASAVIPEDEIPRRNLGTDDSEVEVVDALADRRMSVSEISEQKEEILEVFRTWGGKEAVEAAEVLFDIVVFLFVVKKKVVTRLETRFKFNERLKIILQNDLNKQI